MEYQSGFNKLKEMSTSAETVRATVENNYIIKSMALSYAIQTVDNEGEKITADQLIIAAKKIEDYLNNNK